MKKKNTAAMTLLGACALAGYLSFAGGGVYGAQSGAGDVRKVASQGNDAPRPGIVTLRTSSADPLVREAPVVDLAESARIIDTVARFTAAAKHDYSPRYGARTGAVREQLVAQLRDYARYAEEPGHAAAKKISNQIQTATLLKLAEESPTLFRSRIVSASETLVDYALRTKTGVEREKSLAVLMQYYLAVFDASAPAPEVPNLESGAEPELSPEDEDDVSDEELEREKQECFEYYCDELDAAVRAYFNGEGDSSVDAIASALGEMRYYQSESPAVTRLAGYLHGVFNGQNFFLEASERFLSAFTYREIVENFDVNENIRGTVAQGAGALRGHTSIDVKDNEKRAQMAITLSANVSTRTVGESRGVFVHTDNAGAVSASKPIYLNANGLISTSAAAASASMRSTVRGINTDRITLLGGKIIQNKVSQELPASERDGAERIRQRVVKDLDEQANEQILEMNRRVEHMQIGSASSMIQNLTSRSSEERIYLSCVLGRGLQFSVPQKGMDSALSALRRYHSPENFNDAYIAAETSEHSSEPFFDHDRPRAFGGALAPFAANLRNRPIVVSSTSRLEPLRALRPSGASSVQERRDEADLVVRFHQSAPNNAATIALAGALFGPGYDTLDSVILRFPGVEPDDVKRLLVPYEPRGARDLDPEDAAKRIFVRFDEVQPFSTHFENGAITTMLRLSSCDVDGVEWGPIEVRMVYRLERRGDSFVFVRDELEVMPGGYQEGDAVSARFYTFRRIAIKRLETTINEEYVFSPMPVDTILALENRGYLVPSKVEIEDGWIRVEFNLEAKPEGDADATAMN